MNVPNNDPVISYDPDRQIVTVNGVRFTREFFSAFDKHHEAIHQAISKGEMTVNQGRQSVELAPISAI